MGRPPVWGGSRGLALVRAVNAELKTGKLKHDDRNAIRVVCGALVRRAPWRKYAPETLRQYFYAARKRHGDKPKTEPRKILVALDLALVDAWIDWAVDEQSSPEHRKRRVSRGRALNLLVVILREIKKGEWPARRHREDAEHLLKRLRKPEKQQ